MRQQTPLRALGASWVSAWGFPLRRPSATFFRDVLSPSGEAMRPSGFIIALFICLQSMVLCDYCLFKFCFTFFFFPFFQLSYRFSSFVYFSFNYCLFVYWLYVLFCMVPLCTGLLSLFFCSFLLGPASRVLLFILALNYIIM